MTCFVKKEPIFFVFAIIYLILQPSNDIYSRFS